MRRSDAARYRDFVLARLDHLRRSAYLLCRDWQLADDLVSVTLTKLYRNWRRATEAASLDSYVRSILARAWVDRTRDSWLRDDGTLESPDVASAAMPVEAVLHREALAKLLTDLTARQRAAMVLRFYCDMSVGETADVLGVSEATLKTQSARGQELLRLAVPLPARGGPLTGTNAQALESSIIEPIPPFPSVDDVIAGERRRQRVRRSAGALGIAAAVRARLRHPGRTRPPRRRPTSAARAVPKHWHDGAADSRAANSRSDRRPPRAGPAGPTLRDPARGVHDGRSG